MTLAEQAAQAVKGKGKKSKRRGRFNLKKLQKLGQERIAERKKKEAEDKAKAEKAQATGIAPPTTSGGNSSSSSEYSSCS